MIFEKIYENLPDGLQNIACSMQGWRIQRSRYASAFWKELERVEARGAWSHEQVCAFRDRRLRAFVKHAAETTPYYRNLFNKLGLSPADIKTLDDMKVLPVLSKAQVQAAPEQFLSCAVPKQKRIVAHTSGSTGSGLVFATTIEAQWEQWAVWWRYWRWHGLQPGTWCGYFGGRSVVPVSRKQAPFWRINYPGRQILFSAYHTSPGNLVLYLEELRRRRPPWLHGYPSQLALIAGHIIESGFDLGYQPHWITVGAENLLPSQVRVIAAAFGRAPIQHYGMAEAVANVSQRKTGNLHVDEDFAAVEFLPLEDDKAYRVVGTNFSNLATPLLRYEVGDHAELTPNPSILICPGRKVNSIDGRQEDYVLTKNGTKIGRLDHIFKDFMNIREAQIRQSHLGRVNVYIVKNATYDPYDESELRRAFASRLGTDMEVDINYVDRLERTQSGKLRFVISDISSGNIDRERS
ncbi:phenylacetate--CoA ligase family protein [Aquamicrobium defluvii]|uniref:Phenylacetate-CoA ligase n=1 Tax=Aquamicrobium defluvii TaxID=69279 RepID=A0A4R6YIH0_9HYPH|nr:phenylacetate--CoA ligase family protein [Aquamicrobium defluvii]TDR36472.1 phenylacetate-CoA ligase [Aquamicrobium defluvii]